MRILCLARGGLPRFADCARCGADKRKRDLFRRLRLLWRAARHEFPVRLDRGGVDAREFRHATGERGKFHRLEEGDQPLVVGIVHCKLGERHLEFDVCIERDELLRQPRLFGVLDEGLAPLLLLDLAGAR